MLDDYSNLYSSPYFYLLVCLPIEYGAKVVEEAAVVKYPVQGAIWFDRYS